MLGEGWDLHGDGYGNMSIYVDVARGAVMQVFHACEKRMGMVARERKGGGNDNG